jgi:rod shape-determining protein MreD
MNRFLFVFVTLLTGLLVQLFFERYLSLFNASPQLILLAVVAHGFLFGPIVGEILGFFWGIVCDSMGTDLFGLNTLILTIAGYVSGKLRRRVASERAAGQLVIALFATIYYWLAAAFLYSVFEDVTMRIPLLTFVLELLLNVVFVSVVFWLTDRWVDIWGLEREHI